MRRLKSLCLAYTARLNFLSYVCILLDGNKEIINQVLQDLNSSSYFSRRELMSKKKIDAL